MALKRLADNFCEMKLILVGLSAAVNWTRWIHELPCHLRGAVTFIDDELCAGGRLRFHP